VEIRVCWYLYENEKFVIGPSIGPLKIGSCLGPTLWAEVAAQPLSIYRAGLTLSTTDRASSRARAVLFGAVPGAANRVWPRNTILPGLSALLFLCFVTIKGESNGKRCGLLVFHCVSRCVLPRHLRSELAGAHRRRSSPFQGVPAPDRTQRDLQSTWLFLPSCLPFLVDLYQSSPPTEYSRDSIESFLGLAVCSTKLTHVPVPSNIYIS
jgi:hypothetical protein